MDAVDPNENPEGYILHLEELLRGRQRTIENLEWKLKEVHRCACIQEECATTALAHAERMEAQRNDLLSALTFAEDVLSRFPFSGKWWPEGSHPHEGITRIREAIAKAST
jgi:hypothetical protein